MIYLHWKKYQENMMQRLKEVGEALVMAGDGRYDSMGAKYGAYTIFCCTLSKIVHFSLVQVRNYLFLLPYYGDIHLFCSTMKQALQLHADLRAYPKFWGC